MRRALASFAAFGTLVASLVAGPGVARADKLEDLRVRRSALVGRIAELSDRLEAAEVQVVRAQTDRRRLRSQQTRIRRRLQKGAMAAYVDRVSGRQASTPVQLYVGGAGLQAAARDHRQELGRLRTAKERAEAAQAEAEQAGAGARTAASELERARRELDGTIGRQIALDEASRRAAEARRAAMTAAEARQRATLALANGPYQPRHIRATARQAEIMARYPFGPMSTLPNTLRRTGQSFDGVASWYGPGFDGRATASGAVYDQEGWTVASRTLPLGTFLLVSRGGRQVLLLVNDRGPYIDGRVLDLSHAAAVYLGVGVSPVHAEVVVPAQ